MCCLTCSSGGGCGTGSVPPPPPETGGGGGSMNPFSSDNCGHLSQAAILAHEFQLLRTADSDKKNWSAR